MRKRFEDEREVAIKTYTEFEADGMHSDTDLVEQYLNLKPKFKLVFEKFRNPKGWLDAQSFVPLVKCLYQQDLALSLAEYDRRIAESKDCFREPMRETVLSWANMHKDEKGRCPWDQFWGFLSSPAMLARIRKEGLRDTFLAFELWEIPTYQQEFASLKSRFGEAFKKYDGNANGFIDREELETFIQLSLPCFPYHTTESFRNGMFCGEAAVRGFITWGEFWKFFSTGKMFPTNQEELDNVYATLAVWGV